MTNLPSLRQLQYLTALADFGSFSKAADYCHVTQSTLSAGVATLEDTLGRPVVDRSRRKIALTALGEVIVEKGRKILIDAGDLVAAAQQNEATLSGPLRLGIIPTIAPYFLPRLLPQLSRQAPAIDLALIEDLSQRLLVRLQQGSIDLALFAFPFDTPGMTQAPLFQEDFYLATPKGSRDKSGLVSLNDLENEKLLLLEDGHCLREHALEACKLHPSQERRAFSATSLPTLVQMVQHGYGMTLLPAMVVESLTSLDEIDILPFAPPRPQRTIGLLWRENSPRRKSYQLLADIVMAASQSKKLKSTSKLFI